MGSYTPWKFNSSPLKSYMNHNSKGKRLNVFHHFSGVNSLLDFGRVRKDLQGWVKDKKMLNMISKDDRGSTKRIMKHQERMKKDKERTSLPVCLHVKGMYFRPLL